MTFESFLSQFSGSLDQNNTFVSLAIATLGGVIASAVCPCTLPVGLGMASITSLSETRLRRSGAAVALAFLLGIVTNLTLLGMVAGRLNFLITESFGTYWALVMAVASFLGAYIAFRGPKLRVRQLENLRRPGLIGAFSYGFIFSLGTSVAPLLLLLSIVVAQSNSVYGLALAFMFGIGRGFPFLLIGLFSSVLIQFTKVNSWRQSIQFLSSAGLLIVGVYYVRSFLVLRGL